MELTRWTTVCLIRKQPFALNADMIELKGRVHQLEGLVHQLAAALRLATQNQPQLNSAQPYSQIKAEQTNSAFHHHKYSLPPAHRHESADEESVAAVLQQLSEGSPSTSAKSGPGSFEYQLNQLLTQLPSRKMCDTLVASFFARVDWQIHVSPHFATGLPRFGYPPADTPLNSSGPPRPALS